MKKKTHLIAALLVAASFSSFSQADPSGKGALPKKSSATVSRQKKASRIKELETKISINKTDPTFPPGELEKQKRELAELKKAKTTSEK